MDWSALGFLGQPWFVLPWYAIGVLGVLLLIYDTRHANTALKPAMKWAWPIIVLFFSVVGLALYFATARAPGIGKKKGEEEKKKAHHEYERSMWRRVNGAVIHCVAGDGFGIMTAMVLARASGMSFWQEFWFEYLIGFVIGWLVFQRESMTMMTDNLPKQLAMSFRAEFFSMLTVMGGMGVVMAYVTPMVVTSQPRPFTYAFWGFGMFGLLVGFAFTFPMNWMMVKVGWKHGMGGVEAAEEKQVEGAPKKAGLVAAMSVLGAAALVFPAWLTHVRETAPAREQRAAIVPAPDARPGQALAVGVRTSVRHAIAALESRRRGEATAAMDEAMRAAEAGLNAAPGSFYDAAQLIRGARIALQQGSPSRAIDRLEKAYSAVRPAPRTSRELLDIRQYRGAKVIDPEGAIIGEVEAVTGDTVELALGGWRDAWGFIDFSAARRVSVPVSAVAFGPPRTFGSRLVAVPTEREPSHAG